MNWGKVKSAAKSVIKRILSVSFLIIKCILTWIKDTTRFSFPAVVVFIILVLTLARDVRRATIVFEGIEPCPSLQALGFNKPSCTNMLIDHVSMIFEKSYAHNSQMLLTTSDRAAAPALDIPSRGISYDGLLQFCRRLFRVDEPHVHGELV